MKLAGSARQRATIASSMTSAMANTESAKTGFAGIAPADAERLTKQIGELRPRPGRCAVDPHDIVEATAGIERSHLSPCREECGAGHGSLLDGGRLAPENALIRAL